jgi:hypothetical protein
LFLADQKSNKGVSFLKLKYKGLALKIELLVFGLLVFFVGLYPFLFEWDYLPEVLNFLPMEGLYYQLIIMVLGLFALIFGFKTGR